MLIIQRKAWDIGLYIGIEIVSNRRRSCIVIIVIIFNFVTMGIIFIPLSSERDDSEFYCGWIWGWVGWAGVSLCGGTGRKDTKEGDTTRGVSILLTSHELKAIEGNIKRSTTSYYYYYGTATHTYYYDI